jgi:GntR family transcriptional regulator
VTAGKAAAPAPVAEILGIPSGRRALRRTETRGDNGQAASITVSWYPPVIADRAPRLADDQPLPAGTLAYIAEVTGSRAARVDEDHAGGPAEEDAAASLGIAPGSAVLLTHARQYTADGKLIEYAETTTAAGRWHSRTYTITGN